MLENGFIKLHRSILGWGWYGDTNVFRLFLHLLLSANYKPKEWRGMTVERGQIVTGMSKLSEQTGLSVKACRVALEKLRSTGEVASKGHSKYTVITVLKYDLYQSEGQTNGEQTASEGQAEGKQGANEGQQRKKDKKDKKARKQEGWSVPLPPDAQEIFSPDMLLAITDWLTYKHERREDYKPTGLRNFLSELQNKAAVFGDAAVCAAMRLSMSNNWRGIVWEKINAKRSQDGAPQEQAKQLTDWEREQLARVKAHRRQDG